MTPMREDDQLDALFQAYRSACPTPEPGVNFMPQLWARIEARQNDGFSFRRMANALVTAALAASLCLGVYTTVRHSDAAMYSQSYVEALVAGSTVDTELVAPARLEIDQAPPVN